MGKQYEPPKIQVDIFEDKDFMTSSGGLIQISKNPGHHMNCTVLPNGKPIPEDAVGYWGNHDEP